VALFQMPLLLGGMVSDGGVAVLALLTQKPGMVVFDVFVSLVLPGVRKRMRTAVLEWARMKFGGLVNRFHMTFEVRVSAEGLASGTTLDCADEWTTMLVPEVLLEPSHGLELGLGRAVGSRASHPIVGSQIAVWGPWLVSGRSLTLGRR